MSKSSPTPSRAALWQLETWDKEGGRGSHPKNRIPTSARQNSVVWNPVSESLWFSACQTFPGFQIKPNGRLWNGAVCSIKIHLFMRATYNCVHINPCTSLCVHIHGCSVFKRMSSQQNAIVSKVGKPPFWYLGHGLTPGRLKSDRRWKEIWWGPQSHRQSLQTLPTNNPDNHNDNTSNNNDNNSNTTSNIVYNNNDHHHHHDHHHHP